jgi:hypothetical protein
MSWLFSQALVEEYLGDTCLDGKPSVPLSGNNTQQAYCAPDKMTKFSRLSRFGMTYKPLTESRGEELLTLYLEDFHAKTSVQQEKAQALKETNPQCGNTWQGSFARLDPNTSLWRTAQCSLLKDLELSLQIFPRWGLMQNGALYQLPILVQTISEKEYGSEQKQMFLTPRVVEIDESPENFRRRMNSKRPNDRKNGFASLTMQVTWATPTVCGNYNQKGASKTSGDGLATQVGGKLNPTWVEWLMGWPLGWTDLNPLEMGKYPFVQQQHGSCLNEKQ